MATPSAAWLLESLRKDKFSWISYLPRDITQWISQMTRPINQHALWQSRHEMNGKVSLLEDGTVCQNEQKTCPKTQKYKRVTGHFTLPFFLRCAPTYSPPISPDSATRSAKFQCRLSSEPDSHLYFLHMGFNPETYVFYMAHYQAKLELVPKRYVTRRCDPCVQRARAIALDVSGLLYVLIENQIYQINVLTLTKEPTLTLIYEGEQPIRMQIVSHGLVIVFTNSVAFYDQRVKQITRRFNLSDVTAVVPDPEGDTFYLQVDTNVYGVTDNDEVILKCDRLLPGSNLTIIDGGYLLVLSSSWSCIFY